MIEKFKQPKHFSIPARPSKAKHVLFRQSIAKFQASGMPLLFEVSDIKRRFETELTPVI